MCALFFAGQNSSKRCHSHSVGNQAQERSHISLSVKNWEPNVTMWSTDCTKFPNGFLAVSPDGFVGDSVVLAVKCQWRRKTHTISEFCVFDKYFCISHSDGIADDSHGVHLLWQQLLSKAHSWSLSPSTRTHVLIWKNSMPFCYLVQIRTCYHTGM